MDQTQHVDNVNTASPTRPSLLPTYLAFVELREQCAGIGHGQLLPVTAAICARRKQHAPSQCPSNRCAQGEADFPMVGGVEAAHSSCFTGRCEGKGKRMGGPAGSVAGLPMRNTKRGSQSTIEWSGDDNTNKCPLWSSSTHMSPAEYRGRCNRAVSNTAGRPVPAVGGERASRSRRHSFVGHIRSQATCVRRNHSFTGTIRSQKQAIHWKQWFRRWSISSRVAKTRRQITPQGKRGAPETQHDSTKRSSGHNRHPQHTIDTDERLVRLPACFCTHPTQLVLPRSLPTRTTT